ncbi:putative quinol monooxygenase [Campylobacter hyointestinalis]|uniref:putative quinol monooxygenase n=1 Tax=Campylobacter hyointestinalis TaxID=198 RepID=UPI000CE4AC59|nr:putative quinol monooxygenase [Campylobacter hyointestinalis]PPB74356.1 antibiotic biosynthesis monooxygenase [Campylobacter hyointestinalis subsp. hyointestinalis]PPB74924.1 antibiotic biosynthesis monooxygenase [Campylobacter hyointestinalis subsp. hyointestinalis]PPB77597.1 antibiotic biosynthesis monooxygenase [Campylobacter hyointestinalis subsp. hyointestinalis]PPB78813.1 antibiotic biosynthesis monooxygenase [Campylobacter hyointestinalis subsp. hyointestinalis]RAZ54683.1 antibiotic 
MKQFTFLIVGIIFGIGLSICYNMFYTTTKTLNMQNIAVRFAYLEIMPDKLDEFLQGVKKGMKTSVQTEEGVLALYALADQNDPTKMTFFEMYASDEAYEKHRQTKHFKEYFNSTKDFVTKRVLFQTTPVQMQDKNTKYE